MDQGQADITLTPELMSAQIFREKFVNLKAGLKYMFKVSSDTWLGDYYGQMKICQFCYTIMYNGNISNENVLLMFIHVIEMRLMQHLTVLYTYLFWTKFINKPFKVNKMSLYILWYYQLTTIGILILYAVTFISLPLLFSRFLQKPFSKIFLKHLI